MSGSSHWHAGLGRRGFLGVSGLATMSHLGGCAGAGGFGGEEATFPLTDPDRPPPSGPLTGGLVTTLAWSPDGRRLAACATSIRHLHLWDMTTGALVTRVPRRQTTRNAVAFTRDGRYLLATLHQQPIGQGTHAFSVLDAATGAEVLEVREGLVPGVGGGAERLAVSPDGRWVAAMFDPNHVAVYDTATWAVAGSIGLGGFFGRNLSFSSDGERLAVVGARHGTKPGPEAGPLEVWAWRRGQRVLSVPLMNWPSGAVAWQPGGDAVAVGTGGQVTVLPDGRSAPFEDRVILLDGRTGARLQTWRWATDEASARALDWSPDGRRIAVAAGWMARVVEPGSEREVQVGAPARRTACWAVAYAPDGRRIARGRGSAVQVSNHRAEAPPHL